MTEKILITSALPYANGPLHFGHIAGAYLPGDCYARFKRLKKKDVLYICGSDEYGVAITIHAEMMGRTPKEHVDIYHEVNKNFFDRLNISFDHYSRTTWKGHEKPVLEFFRDLVENGYIEPRITDQLYSEEDQSFLADRYVVGTCPKCAFEKARGDECPKCGASYEATDLLNPRSKLTNASLALKPTKHWFLLCDKLKEKILLWIKEKKWKPNVLNFAKKYLEDLRPRAITRDSAWGIPVPIEGEQGKVFYVWFDAPIGYISASMEWAEKKGNSDLWKEYWQDPLTKYVQFIGKDNIPFHAIFFPAMLLGQDQPYKTVDELSANEFYNLEGKAFSKTEGWYIDLDDFFERYSSDQIRYAIAATAPESSDSEFKWKSFQRHCNSELLGKYGNLVNRTLVFARKHCKNKIPKSEEIEKEDEEFLKNIRILVAAIEKSYDSFRLLQASQQLMELAHLGNVYFDFKKPWVDLRDESKRKRFETTIAFCIRCLKALAFVSFPIIPETANKLWKMIGYHSDLREESWEAMFVEPFPGQEIPKPEILFNKIEDEQIEEEIAKLKSISERSFGEKMEDPLLKDEITYDSFSKMDLRVAQVVSAVKVPKSRKLLKVEVDMGFEKRTLIAGIGQSYDPEKLIGERVVVLANLKPTKIMGIESQGMILSAVSGKDFELASVKSLPIGSVVS